MTSRDEKIKELLVENSLRIKEDDGHWMVKINAKRFDQALDLLQDQPCKKCQSWILDECTTDVPCDMNYSAFKPKQLCETCGGSGIRQTSLNGCVDIRWMEIPCPDCGEKGKVKDGTKARET